MLVVDDERDPVVGRRSLGELGFDVEACDAASALELSSAARRFSCSHGLAAAGHAIYRCSGPSGSCCLSHVILTAFCTPDGRARVGIGTVYCRSRSRLAELNRLVAQDRRNSN